MKRFLLRVIAPSIPLLAVLLWQIAETKRAHDLQVTQAVAEQAAERIDAELALLAHELDLFERLPSVQDGDLARVTRDAEQVSFYLRGWLMLVENGSTKREILDANGASASSGSEDQDHPAGETNGGDTATQPETAADPTRIVVSDIHPGTGLDVSVFTLSKQLIYGPFSDHQLVLKVAASRLAKKLSDITLPQDGEVAIVDGAGQMIGGTDDMMIQQLPPVPNGLSQALASSPQGSTTDDLVGFGLPQSVTVWQRLSNAPQWVVVANLPKGQPGANYGTVAWSAAFLILTFMLLTGRHARLVQIEQNTDVQAKRYPHEINRLAKDVQALRRDLALRDEQQSMLFHDMRTSLLGTQDLIQRMTLASSDSGQTFYLNSMLAATGRMLRMIDEPQVIGPEAGAPSPARLEPFSPNTLLASLPPLIEGLAQKNGSILSVDLARNMPWLMGDATQIGQIVLNLLGNAAKFTRDGVVSLAGRVERLRDSTQRGRLVITVTDTGPGIAAQELSKIFTPRFRGAQQDDHEVEGSGLGLAIVKRLVDAMQGSIAVDSVVGRGTVFTLTLPLDLARPVDRADPGTPPDLLTGRRVLLVDDDPTMLLAGSKALQRAGAQVRLANTAEDALAACQDASPDAFVLDLNIPGVDVAELVRAIRSMPKLQERPIIAFSAKMDAQRAADCRAMGFDAAIQKDADLPLVVAEVLLAA